MNNTHAAQSEGRSHEAAGFFVLRAATLPIDGLQALATADRAANREELPVRDDAALQPWIDDPWVRAALYLASPSLSERIAQWRDQRRLETFAPIRMALFRYFVRMSSRPTPFGLFASFTMGLLGPAVRMELGSRQALHRKSWLDLGFVHALVEPVVGHPEVRTVLRYLPNSTLFKQCDGWRYVQQEHRNGRRRRLLIRVESADVLDGLLAACGAGRTHDELCDMIVTDARPPVTHAQAREYLKDLIDSQILVSTLAPSLTGPDPVSNLLRESRVHAPLAEFHATLAFAVQGLEAADRGDVADVPSHYDGVAGALAGRVTGAAERHRFHVDLRRDAPHLALPESLLADVFGAVEALQRITSLGWPRDSLERFRARFEDRYGDREVDLLSVLDEDSGIGFDMDPSSRRNEGLLGDFEFRGTAPAAIDATLDSRAMKLMALVDHASFDRRLEIRLTDADIDGLAVRDTLPLPDVLTALGVVLPRLPTAENRNTIGFALQGASAGVGLLGRFCRSDAELTECVRALLRKEEALRPDALFAEVVHLPEDRIGNIVCRPALRSAELPYLGHSGLPISQQIAASDLTVSRTAHRIVLRSRTRGCEVLPRLTCAHNVTAPNSSVYRFLAALSRQDGVNSLAFHWGGFLELLPFLPRVTYGTVTLKAASWHIPSQILSTWTELSGPERLRALGRWQLENRVPRWVQVGRHDTLLSLDLTSAIGVDALLDELRRNPSTRLVELLPQPDQFLARSPEGRHAHEVLLPFIRKPGTSPFRTALSSPRQDSRARSFPPGSGWLYAKIYGSVTSSEQALLSEIAPLAERGLATGAIARWHFVRYRDPQDHVRVRFQGDPKTLRVQIQPTLQGLFQRWLDRGTIWRCQFDTYERELIRYGGSDAIEIAEAIFQADSELVCALLSAAPATDALDWRWQMSTRAVDVYQEAFGFDIRTRRALAADAERSLRQEFGLGKEFDAQVSRRFRRERVVLTALFDDHSGYPRECEWAAHPMMAFRAKLGPLATRYRDVASDGRLIGSLHGIVHSLAHMHVNRMMRTNAREHEMLIYGFLDRIARRRLAVR